MKRMGAYCKAFYLGRLREFAGWAERPVSPDGGAAGESTAPADGPALRDEDIVYLQEDYTVTKGIFIDEETIFDNDAPDWIEFCRDALNFAPPERGPGLSFGAQAGEQPA
jgi:hypothetical protein